jgi:hypothetical protein
MNRANLFLPALTGNLNFDFLRDESGGISTMLENIADDG